MLISLSFELNMSMSTRVCALLRHSLSNSKEREEKKRTCVWRSEGYIIRLMIENHPTITQVNHIFENSDINE